MIDILSIDEVIAQEREISQKQYEQSKEYSRYSDECFECEKSAKEHEQLAEWLEELKFLKSEPIDCGSDAGKAYIYNLGRENGYNKAIDDAKDVILQSLDNELLVDTLHLRLEQLKAGGEE